MTARVYTMSTNLPRTIPELLVWAATHEELWVTNGASIGLTTSQVASFRELRDVMVSKVSAADIARVASKNATMDQTEAITAFRAITGAYISIIRGFAESSNNPGVYALAGISPDDPRSTLPPPNTPEMFTANVNPDGSLTIKWKVAQPAGVTNVSYIVRRRLNGAAGAFVQLGSATTKKSYTDETLPVGVDRVEYMIQPTRGTVVGPQSPIFTVQFGSVALPPGAAANGSGGTFSIASTRAVPHEQPVRVAA